MKPLIAEWDHALALPDTLACTLSEIFGRELKMVTVPFNPTAERMAKYFFDKLVIRMAGLKKYHFSKCQLEKVRVHETATGWAEYTPDS